MAESKKRKAEEPKTTEAQKKKQKHNDCLLLFASLFGGFENYEVLTGVEEDEDGVGYHVSFRAVDLCPAFVRAARMPFKLHDAECTFILPNTLRATFIDIDENESYEQDFVLEFTLTRTNAVWSKTTESTTIIILPEDAQQADVSSLQREGRWDSIMDGDAWDDSGAGEFGVSLHFEELVVVPPVLPDRKQLLTMMQQQQIDVSQVDDVWYAVDVDFQRGIATVACGYYGVDCKLKIAFHVRASCK